MPRGKQRHHSYTDEVKIPAAIQKTICYYVWDEGQPEENAICTGENGVCRGKQLVANLHNEK